jgi:hypothetical protein
MFNGLRRTPDAPSASAIPNDPIANNPRLAGSGTLLVPPPP